MSKKLDNVWRYREPPAENPAEYQLCSATAKTCPSGDDCPNAHGEEELKEWLERYTQNVIATPPPAFSEHHSFAEQLFEKCSGSLNVEDVMCDNVDGVEDDTTDNLVVLLDKKNTVHKWNFSLTSDSPLKNVALLNMTQKYYFVVSNVKITSDKGEILVDEESDSGQEWALGTNEKVDEYNNSNSRVVYKITVVVSFQADVYGTFKQSVVFNFDKKPVLMKKICADLMPCNSKEKLDDLHKTLVLLSDERWNERNVDIELISWTQEPTFRQKGFMLKYAIPAPEERVFTAEMLDGSELTPDNYEKRMHQILYCEEITQHEKICKFNIRETVRLVKRCDDGVLDKNDMLAELTFSELLTEDSPVGRLLMNTCNTVMFALLDNEVMTNDVCDNDGVDKKKGNKRRQQRGKKGKKPMKRKVYETSIVIKNKDKFFFDIPASFAEQMGWTLDMQVVLDLQFQPNRVPFCEWHNAVDSVPDLSIVFPHVNEHVMDAETNSTRAKKVEERYSGLNKMQLKAIVAISSPAQLPPVVIAGPYGTGKTYTLVQAIKEVLRVPNTRILICTLSNSAADLYITDYLHPYVIEGHKEATPLRIYYGKRWTTTVHPVVLRYCYMETKEGKQMFGLPALDVVGKHRVIIATLGISDYLTTLASPKHFFTHIFIDEAAQVLECQCLVPLALASANTRIVLAGDYMQLSPEVFSECAKELKLQTSMLERLYHYYPDGAKCKILLEENYRAHEAINDFTGEVFYEHELKTNKLDIPRHPRWYPLTFYTVCGGDKSAAASSLMQTGEEISTSFYNYSEVYEVVEQVKNLTDNWPKCWGPFDGRQVCVITPYTEQVLRIRRELRRHNFYNISVERVLNIQGREFRAVFISTVRTAATCDYKLASEMDYGFLTNKKLLNTAITRARSLLVVVGDPVALCSIGACEKIWHRYLKICGDNGSLFGMNMARLEELLEIVHVKREYPLNPLAEVFVPIKKQLPQDVPNPFELPFVTPQMFPSPVWDTPPYHWYPPNQFMMSHPYPYAAGPPPYTVFQPPYPPPMYRPPNDYFLPDNSQYRALEPPGPFDSLYALVYTVRSNSHPSNGVRRRRPNGGLLPLRNTQRYSSFHPGYMMPAYHPHFLPLPGGGYNLIPPAPRMYGDIATHLHPGSNGVGRDGQFQSGPVKDLETATLPPAVNETVTDERRMMIQRFDEVIQSAYSSGLIGNPQDYENITQNFRDILRVPTSSC